jgi:enoyl-CoA hydratase
MDLKAFATSGPPKGLGDFFEQGARKPIIAAIEGFALAGGLEMALSCDLLVCADNVKFGIPEAGVGLFAGGGALIRLPSRVGYMKAMEMALTADPITAQEAHALGLVSRITEKGKAIDAAMELAERIARNAPLSVAASKTIIKGTMGLTEEEAWKYQQPLFAQVFTSDDAKEGPRAFAEKRAPNWTGR